MHPAVSGALNACLRADMLNVYITLLVLGWQDVPRQVLILDEHPPASLDILWPLVAAGKAWRLGSLLAVLGVGRGMRFHGMVAAEIAILASIEHHCGGPCH